MNKTKTKVLFIIPSLSIRGAQRMVVNLANRIDRDKLFYLRGFAE